MASLVRVSSLGGLLCAVDVRPDCPVSEIKQTISEVTQIPVEVQRLLKDAEELGDNDLLPSTVEELTLVRRTEEQARWLKRVSGRPGHLRLAPESIKMDKEVVLAAVRKYGRALQYAAPALRCDPEIARAAVSQHGSSLEFASPDLCRNRDIVSVAVQQNGVALQFCDLSLMSDIEIVLSAVQTCGLALRYASLVHRVNPKVTLAAVRQTASAVEEMPDTHDLDNLGTLLTAVGVPSVVVDRIVASAVLTQIQKGSSELYKLFPEGQEALELFEGDCRLAMEIVEHVVANTETNVQEDVHVRQQVMVTNQLLVARRAQIQLLDVGGKLVAASTAALRASHDATKAEIVALRAQLPWPVRGLLASQGILRDARNWVSRCRSRSCRRRVQEPELPEEEEESAYFPSVAAVTLDALGHQWPTPPTDGQTEPQNGLARGLAVAPDLSAAGQEPALQQGCGSGCV